jgi:hypothetical protein
LSYRVNPVTSDAINFPAVTIANGTATAGALNYYFGNSGTATTGVTLNQGSIALPAQLRMVAQQQLLVHLRIHQHLIFTAQIHLHTTCMIRLASQVWLIP